MNWLALRSGTREWNARVFVNDNILATLEHGRYYTAQELELRWVLLTRQAEKIPDKFQFIVEPIAQPDDSADS